MTAYHEIFVDTDEPVGTLLADLAEACGTQFAEVEGEAMDYVSHTETAFVDVEVHHQFDNDHSLLFEQYPLLVTVRDRDRDLQRQERSARTLFDALAAKGRYRLMLTYDLTQLIAVYPRP